MRGSSPRGPTPGRWSRAGRRQRGVAGLLAAAALGATAFVALRTSAGQRLDTAGFADLALAGTPLGAVRTGLALVALAAAAAALVAALVRRRRGGRRAPVLVAVLVPVVTYAAAIVLRDLVLTRPDLGMGGYPQNTLPSGHTALVCALAVTTVMLHGRPTRPLLGALTVLVLVTAWVNVASMAHRPSDVVAGILLGAAVGAGLDALTRPGARTSREPFAPAAPVRR